MSWKQPSIERPIPKIKPVSTFIKKIDVELLKKLFSIQTPSYNDVAQRKFMDFILGWCLENKINVTYTHDAYGNLYIVKGKAKLYPCAVSHIDTVHSFNPNLTILNTEYLVFGLDTATGKQHGIGADPKNGVYFILEMLKKLDVLKVVLFKDEEVGCFGSKASDNKFFKDCSFVIQLDRRSFTTDIIEHTNGTQVLSDEFKLAVFPVCEKYGYDFNRGTCTDVGELVWNGIDICAFNFSNGSFNEHQDHETCSLPHLLNAVNAGYDIIKQLGYKKQWVFKSEEQQFKQNKYADTWDDWNDKWYPEAKTTSTDKIYDKYSIETFVNDHVLRRAKGKSAKEAAKFYQYEEGDEENIKWMYDYYIGLDSSELILYDKIHEYLKLNFSKYPDIRHLCSRIKSYSEVVEEFDLAVL